VAGWWFSPGTPVSSINKTGNIVKRGVKHHKTNQPHRNGNADII